MRIWNIIGLVATAIIALTLPIYAFNESNRLKTAQADLITESIKQGQIVYAQNCAVCHGIAGEGIGTYPALANPGVQGMDYDLIFKTIERGRYNTAMAAWSVKEGGVLNNSQIDQLIVLLQQGDWADTSRAVQVLGFTPPTAISVTVSSEVLAKLATLPHGAVISRTLPLYSAKCAGCHSADGSGTSIAPPLNSAALRDKKNDVELQRLIANGVAGTLMAGWQQALTAEQINDLVSLVRYWGEIPAGTIPKIEIPIASTDAGVIAAGQDLFGQVCATCHNTNGQGKRIAPALNVQSFLKTKNDQAIKAIISQGVPNTRMPTWAGRLSEAEINNLVSFIRSWEATAPEVATPPGQQGRGPGWATGGGGGGGGQGWGKRFWQTLGY